MSAQPARTLIGPFRCILLISTLAYAGQKLPKDYDTNKDGRLGFDEFVRYQLAVRDPKLSDLDADGDGIVTAKERDAWAAQYWEDLDHTANDSARISYKDASGEVPAPKPKEWGLGIVRLRKDHDSMTKAPQSADPATFGFYRDNITSKDTWAVQAALGAVYELPLSGNSLSMGNYYIDQLQSVSSVTVNRITGAGAGDLDVTDALAFRTGLWLELDSKAPRSLWDYQIFELTYRNTGGTDSRSKFTSAGELSWEPMRSRAGDLLSINGPEAPLWPDAPFFYRLVFYGKLDFGKLPDETHAGEFLKVGPKAELTLIPVAFERLEAYIGYTQMYELANDSPDFHLLETGVRLALDPNKQIFIEGKYQFGQLPAKFTPVDLWQVSLAAKF